MNIFDPVTGGPRSAARKNSTSSILAGSALPDRVISDRWKRVRFFAMEIAEAQFLTLLQQLLTTEGSSVCFIADLDCETRFGDSDGFFVDLETTAELFALGWDESNGMYPRVSQMASHSIASNAGTWLAYASRQEGVGMVAFQNDDECERFGLCLRQLSADRIETLTQRSAGKFPFTHFVDTWKQRLVANYADI